jgi:uncharacterized protein YeaO (DUF488 family)
VGTSIAQKNIRLKRAYERPSPDDGVRILVDRLWPRGLKKVDAAIDHWMKNVAPSSELRRWFAHDPVRWKEFQRRYKQELKQRQKEINELRTLARHSSIINDCIAGCEVRPTQSVAPTQRPTALWCHVWTAPSWQGFSHAPQAGRCSHVFGLWCGSHDRWP